MLHKQLHYNEVSYFRFPQLTRNHTLQKQTSVQQVKKPRLRDALRLCPMYIGLIFR